MSNASHAANTQYNTISTIAELVFVNTPAMNFARLVSDLDGVLLRFHPHDRTMLWDCDEVAIFDVPGTRIALAYTESPRKGVAASLLIAVGPSPKTSKPARPQPVIRHNVLCSRLVERVQSRVDPTAVLWHESSSQLTSELIDALSSVQPKPAHKAASNQPNSGQPQRQTPLQANDAAPLSPKQDADLLRLRAALYPPATDLPPRLTSNQMRLATHTMNATLIIASLPIGAALTTYAVLRGENLRMTTAAMVFSGLAGTLLQSELGQQLMSIATI